MERIKEAINRARGGLAPAATGMSVTNRRVGVADDHLHQFEYSETRRLEVSARHLKKKRVISGLNDPVATHYKVLRTRLIQRMRANNWRTLGVTSPTEGVGKSLTTINLAISLARELNHTVLLVDLDLRRPKIHKYLFTEELPGVFEYLNGDEPLAEFLVNPSIDRLVVLPGSKPVKHSSELLSSPKMVKLAHELKNRYRTRYVLFDLPPVLACDDVVAFSPYFDAALIVVEDGVTGQEELREAIDLLDDRPVAGVVLNKAEEERRYDY